MAVSLAELPGAAVIGWMRLRDELRTVLGRDLLAMWGHGARALPDPPRRFGDIDACAILERAPAPGAADRIRSAQKAIARDVGVDLDVSYVLARYAARRDDPPDVVRKGRYHETWPLQRAHWLAGRYVHLHGKRAEDVVRRPTWAELERALRGELDHLERHVAAGDVDPYEASYAVLNGSRILHSVATRNVAVSKREAGEWALERLPRRWHRAIRAAVRAYDGDATARDATMLSAAMAPFVSLVRERLPA